MKVNESVTCHELRIARLVGEEERFAGTVSTFKDNGDHVSMIRRIPLGTDKCSRAPTTMELFT